MLAIQHPSSVRTALSQDRPCATRMTSRECRDVIHVAIRGNPTVTIDIVLGHVGHRVRSRPRRHSCRPSGRRDGLHFLKRTAAHDADNATVLLRRSIRAVFNSGRGLLHLALAAAWTVDKRLAPFLRTGIKARLNRCFLHLLPLPTRRLAWHVVACGPVGSGNRLAVGRRLGRALCLPVLDVPLSHDARHQVAGHQEQQEDGSFKLRKGIGGS